MKGAKVLSTQEIQTLLQVESQRDRMLILVGLYFGTRISETVQLVFGDFTGESVRIKSVKRSNDRQLMIPDQFKAELDKLKLFYLAKGCPVSDGTPLFLSQKKYPDGNCRPITPEHASLILKRLRTKYNLDNRVSAHSFRKNFTTRIHELCKHNLAQTAIYTGHKSLDSLSAYIKTTEETNLTKQLNWI